MIRTVLAAALLAAATPSFAQSAGRGAADEIRLDELVLGARLSPAERSVVSQAWDGVARTDPQLVSNYEQNNLRVMVPRVQGWNAGQRALYSMQNKRGVILGTCPPGLAPICVAEVPIFEAHDPVVLVDPANKRVFERSTVDALVRGARIVAKRLNVPAPGEDAGEGIAATIRAQDSAGHAQILALMQNAPALVAQVPSQSTPRDQRLRAIVAPMADPASRNYVLAAMAMKDSQSETGGGANGALAMQVGRMSRLIDHSALLSCLPTNTERNFAFCTGAY